MGLYTHTCTCSAPQYHYTGQLGESIAKIIPGHLLMDCKIKNIFLA